jgi:hypothetical protein
MALLSHAAAARAPGFLINPHAGLSARTVMKKTFKIELVLALSVVLFSGCATHYTVPMADMVVPPPGIMQKIPLNAAILITDQTENYTNTVRDEADLLGTTYAFPLGRIIKKTAVDSLSPAFNKVVVVNGQPYPHDTDVVVVPKVEAFSLRLPPAGFSKEAFAKISMGFGVYDINGRLIWQETVSPPEVPGKTPFMGEQALLAATGIVAAESVVVALQKAAKAMTVSREMQAFVSERGVSEAVASKPAEKQTPVVSSDVEAPPSIAIKRNPNAYAVVIGIEAYRQRLPKADFAVRDARTVTDYLVKAMGYPEENVVTLSDDQAALGDFVKYFEKWLPNNVEPGSTVFVYYSGHGAPDPKTGSAYLVPYDGDPTFIAETGYSLSRMYAALGKLPAKEIIVALDSCFSGAGGRSVLAKGARPLVMNLQTGAVASKNMTVLAASSGEQISSTYDEKGHGLFTYFLLKGIKNEDVIQPDGSIRMDDLYGYLKPQVERIARKQYNNEQTPQLIESEGRQ